MPQRRQPSTARKSGQKPTVREEISTKREEGIYYLGNDYFKVMDGKLTYIDDTLLTKETGEAVKKRLRRAKNEEGLLEFVLEYNCRAEDFIHIEYMDGKDRNECYASLHWCNSEEINVDLYDRRVVHKHSTSYKRSSCDDTIKWKNICSISRRWELPIWTPEDTPNCSTCSRNSDDESEADEEYEESVGEGSLE
jgi:hypothetical protein